MGRHSNRPTVRAVAAPPPSKSKETTMTLWRWLLVGFLALWIVGTGVGLVKMWPGDQKPNIAPEFYTSFNLGHKQVNGTVLFVQPGACSAAETGTLFDTAPRVVLGASEECEWYIIEISEGAGAGMRTLIINSNQPGEPKLEQGDKILLLESEGENGAPLYAFSDLERTMPLLSWGILIALVIIACVLLRGVRALIGLLITMHVVEHTERANDETTQHQPANGHVGEVKNDRKIVLVAQPAQVVIVDRDACEPRRDAQRDQGAAQR